MYPARQALEVLKSPVSPPRWAQAEAEAEAEVTTTAAPSSPLKVHVPSVPTSPARVLRSPAPRARTPAAVREVSFAG
jgi:hypothetical protein